MHAAEWIAVLVLMVAVLVGAGAVLLGWED
jgi:hypothetical protein